MCLFIKRPNLLPLALIALAGILTPARGASFFVEGTYAGDTRYDVKKLFDGNDDTLCWVATASNMIDLWQWRNSARLPAGVPHGQTQSLYSSDVFYTFVYSFKDAGGFDVDAFSWWVNGVFQEDFDYEMRPDPLSQGGYYSAWGWSGFARTVDIKAEGSVLFGVLSSSLEANYLLTAGLFSDVNDSMGHAVSLWGYETDDFTGELTGLWIGDSDSAALGNLLVDINWNDALDRWDLSGDYAMWYLNEVTLFHAPLIPEPSVALLLGFGAAGVVFAARRLRAKRPAGAAC